MTLIPGPNNSLISASLPPTGSYTPYFSALTTDAPNGSPTSSVWQFGPTGSATVSLVTTKYVSVQIDGVVYKLGLVN